MPKLCAGTVVREAQFGRAKDWISLIPAGGYKPRMAWESDLIGYEAWHETGCGTMKAKSPDAQNWAETICAVARWLREADIIGTGKPVARSREEYWSLVLRLARVTATRLRAAVALLNLEAKEHPDWPVYCWMWCQQCLKSENETPEWFRGQLERHSNTRIGDLKEKAERYFALDGNWVIAQRWFEKSAQR